MSKNREIKPIEKGKLKPIEKGKLPKGGFPKTERKGVRGK